MERPDWAPEGIDIERPSASRIYDYWLGGSHNFAVDREMARKAVALIPEVPVIMQRNRAFLHRAVRFLVEAGIRQFLDLGSGIPTLGNVHEVVQSRVPDGRVVYVDVDPVAVAHSRHILSGNANVAVLQEDVRHVDRILTHPETARLLDFSQPVAVLLIAVLHFIPDEDDPYGIVARLRAPLVAGSYVALSHGTADRLSPDSGPSAIELMRQTPTPYYSRTRKQVEDFFTGLELVEPGVVWTPEWRPEHPDEVGDDPDKAATYAGVGRKT